MKLSSASPPPGPGHAGRRAHLLEIAEPLPHHVDGVRTRRAEPPAADAGFVEPLRHPDRRVGEQRREVDEPHEARLADRSGANRVGHRHPLGEPPQLVPEGVHDAGTARRREHLAGLVEVERERLLADHVTAGGDRLERHLRVLRGRRRDRHRVDAGDRERLGQRAARVLDPGAIGPASGALGVAPDDRPHVEAGGAERGNVHPRAPNAVPTTAPCAPMG